MKCYLIDIILPSVGIPEKGSYTLQEVSTILGKSVRQVRRYIVDRDLISVRGRVYKQELIKYVNGEIKHDITETSI